MLKTRQVRDMMGGRETPDTEDKAGERHDGGRETPDTEDKAGERHDGREGTHQTVKTRQAVDMMGGEGHA